MDFFIREELAVATPNIVDLFEKESSSAGKRTGKRFVVEIAAIHEGTSKNYNRYTAEALNEAANSWLTPYPKPVLINHNIEAEPLGRILKSSVAKNAEGVSYIQLRAGLSDPEAIAKVLDGRYLTGSVGAMPASAICSICNSDVVESSKDGSFCGHERGRTYDGETCVYEHKGINFHEYSFVNVPGDSHSLVMGHFSESYNGTLDIYSVDLESKSVHRLTESNGAVNILEHMDTHSANMLYSDLAYGMKFVESDTIHAEQNTNNISFIENTRTIANESDSSDQELGNMTKLISENTDVDVVEDDEDILDVADRLSDELDEEVTASETDEAEETAQVTEEETEAAEEVAVAEDAQEEGVPATDTESETVVEESTDEPEAEVEKPAEEQIIEETTEEPTEETVDEVEVKEEDSETEVEPDPDVAEMQARIDQLVTENETLKAQNTKMKDALHNELAEKVVDARIAVGLLEYEERAEALETCKSRSAASLADALVDIRKYAEKNDFVVNIIKGTVPSLDIKARVTSEESDAVDTVFTEGADIEEEVVIDERDVFVDKFSALLIKGEQKFLANYK